MGQHKDGDSRVINGVTYVRTNGSWLPQTPKSPFASPTQGYDTTVAAAHAAAAGTIAPLAAANLQRTQQEVRQAEATAGATTRKSNAEATSAEIKAKTDEINFRNQSGEVPGNADLRGDEYLKSLPKGMADMVLAMDQGRLGVPINMRNPQMMQVVAAANHYDPSFDATKYNTRLTALKAGAAGKLGSSDNSLNTAIVHAGMLMDQSKGVAGHDTGFGPLSLGVNSIENWSNAGSPGLVTYNDTAGKLAGEEAQAYGMGTQGERGELLKHFDPNMPLASKQASIHNAMDLFASKMAANLHQYQWGNMGNQKPSLDLLDPEARAVLQRIAPDVLAKHFSDSPDPMAVALGVSSAKGGNPPSGGAGNTGGPDVPGPDGSPPPIHPADYSGMVGQNASLAATDPNSKLGAFKQTYRNEFDPVAAGAVNAMIHHGASYDQVAAYAQSHGYTPPDPKQFAAASAFAKTHPAYMAANANKLVPTTLGERLASSPLAAGLAGAASAGTAGFLDTAGRAIAGPGWDANRAALAATNPNADMIGNVAGGVGAMVGGGGLAEKALAAGAKGGLSRNLLAIALKNPVKSGVLGNALYGGIYGANESPSDPVSGAELGTLVGGGTGMFGAGLSKAGGAVVSGVTDPAVQRLAAAKIPLTVGETLGGGVKKAQDAMTSVFGPGSMVARRYADGRQALNEAAFQQAGAPIGAPINGVGQAGIQALDAAKSRAYSNALDPVSLNLATPDAVQGIGSAIRSAKAIPNVDQASDVAYSALENYIGNAAPNGQMTGPDFQQAYRGLSRTAKQASNRIYGHEIGQSLGQGKDALVGALQQQNPGAYEDFLNANAANRNLNVLSDAVNAAKNQIGDNGQPLFTPAQLGQAATANAKRFGSNIAAASGQRPFNQLAMDAQKVMSSKLPESGTFPRQLTGALLTGGISGFGGMFGNSVNGHEGAAEGAVLPLGLLSLLGTRGGQKLLTAALIKRNLQAQIVGRAISANPQIGGSVLTSAGLAPLLGPQAQ